MASQERTRRLSPWARVVTASAVLVLGFVIGLSAWALASQDKRLSSYEVQGAVTGVALDLGDAGVTISGGGRRTGVAVQRRDRFTFNHDALTRRNVSGGTFRVRSRCPDTVFHSCAVSYKLVVPDNVPVNILTSSGDVRFQGYRGSARVTTGSGSVHVAGFCGFSLQARTGSGDIDAATACPPPQMSLRSTSGNIRAAVPAGRYQVDAESSSGAHRVRGISAAADAPFSIQALSSSGRVLVEARP